MDDLSVFNETPLNSPTSQQYAYNGKDEDLLDLSHSPSNDSQARLSARPYNRRHYSLASNLDSKRNAKLLPAITIEDSTDTLAIKRARNTLAARKSREKKLERMETLMGQVEELHTEVEHWKTIAIGNRLMDFDQFSDTETLLNDTDMTAETPHPPPLNISNTSNDQKSPAVDYPIFTGEIVGNESPMVESSRGDLPALEKVRFLDASPKLEQVSQLTTYKSRDTTFDFSDSAVVKQRSKDERYPKSFSEYVWKNSDGSPKMLGSNQVFRQAETYAKQADGPREMSSSEDKLRISSGVNPNVKTLQWQSKSEAANALPGINPTEDQDPPNSTRENLEFMSRKLQAEFSSHLEHAENHLLSSNIVNVSETKESHMETTASPRENLIKPKSRSSLVNRIKILIEDLTQESWYWWPLKPCNRHTGLEYTRLRYECVSQWI